MDGVDVADIRVILRDGPVAVHLDRVSGVHAAVDVAAFLLSDAVTPDLALHATSDGAVFSQDAYFMGFPYGLGLKSAGLTYPFVKKAIFSAFERLSGVTLWFLDGINNPGFSGGPVVFCKNWATDWHVAAVVSGYRTERLAVEGDAGEVPMNTGIIVAYDVQHGIDAIDSFALP